MLRLLSVLLLTGSVLYVQDVSAGEKTKSTLDDLTGFPVLEGTVVQSLGSLNSYLPPQVGDKFTLNISQAGQLDMLSFEASGQKPMGSSSFPLRYIPLPTKQNNRKLVKTIGGFSNGAFARMRLFYKSGDPNPTNVKVDIIPVPGAGNGPDYVRVWIIVESDVVHGMVLVDAKMKKPFPKVER